MSNDQKPKAREGIGDDGSGCIALGGVGRRSLTYVAQHPSAHRTAALKSAEGEPKKSGNMDSDNIQVGAEKGCRMQLLMLRGKINSRKHLTTERTYNMRFKQEA